MVDGESTVFGQFLERSLHVLEREAPTHFAVVRQRMSGVAARIEVHGSPAVRVQLDAKPWLSAMPSADVFAEVRPGDLGAILDGNLTIEEALDQNRLVLRGALDPLLRFLDALSAWLHGAVRCPSMARLYEEYLALALPRRVSDEREHSSIER